MGLNNDGHTFRLGRRQHGDHFGMAGRRGSGCLTQTYPTRILDSVADPLLAPAHNNEAICD